MEESLLKMLLQAQLGEITEYHIYRCLAAREKDPRNREVLESIAIDEKDHYDIWKKYTGEDVNPSKFRVRYYLFLAVIFGLTFTVKSFFGVDV